MLVQCKSVNPLMIGIRRVWFALRPMRLVLKIASRLQSCNRITDLYSRLASASIFNAVSMEAAIEIFGREQREHLV
jgi:hypothetical protein